MKGHTTAKPEQNRQFSGRDHSLHGPKSQAMVLADHRPEIGQLQGIISLMAGIPCIQRQCACGAPGAAGGSCEACEDKEAAAVSLGLQKELVIGSANDPLEQEADQMADQVMNGWLSSPLPSTKPLIQRTAGEQSAESTGTPTSVARVLSGPARPLEPSLRLDMEQKFGYDFSQVKLHTGTDAQQSASDVNAKAYTVGTHIVFGRDHFSPGTLSGRRLLAHELAHVVQQKDGSAGFLQRDVDQKELDMCMASLGDTSQRGKGYIVDRDAGVASSNEIEAYRRECTQRLESANRDRQRSQRIAEAIRRSAKYGSLSGEIIVILGDPVFQVSFVVGVAAYLSLWVVPEPLISKLTAILTTIAIISVGGFSASTIYNLAMAWSRLAAEAGEAKSDQDIEAAAEHFGHSITAIEAQLLVFLASLLLGKAIPGPKGRLPPPEEAMIQAKAKLSSAGSEGVVAERPWGRISTTKLSGSNSAVAEVPKGSFDGNLALKVERFVQPAPKTRPLPEALPAPANDNAIPLAANDNAWPALAAPKPAKPTMPLIPGLGTKADPSDKPDPRKFYPLYWSPLLPPVTSRVFVRTPGRERDTRKAAQASMLQHWRQFRDPDFKAKWVHVHHIIPLFLGGPDDLVGNGVTWTARLHLKGHRDLRIQPQMQTPPNGLPPLPVDLYAHPAGTVYVLAGYKGDLGAPPSISKPLNEPGDPAESDFESD